MRHDANWRMETATLDQPATVDALRRRRARARCSTRSRGSTAASRACWRSAPRMIDQSRGLIEATEAARPTSRGPSADRELARQLLVSELAPLLRIPSTSAARLVAESRALVEELPATLDALGRGEFSYRHAQVVIDNADSLPDEARRDFEQAVLPGRSHAHCRTFRRAGQARARTHAPRVAGARRRTRQFDRRSVAVDPARDGMAWFTAYLPAESAVAIDDRLDQLAGAMRDPARSADLRPVARRRVLRPDGVGRDSVGRDSVDRQGSRSSSRHPGARSRHRAGPDPAATRRRARVARGLWADSRGCRASDRRARHRASRGCSRIPRPGVSSRWDATATRCRPICGSGCGCATRPAACAGVRAASRHLRRRPQPRLGWRWRDRGRQSRSPLPGRPYSQAPARLADGAPAGRRFRWTSPMGRAYLTEPSAILRT